MKKLLATILPALLCALAFTRVGEANAATPAATAAKDDGWYAFIVVDGVHKERNTGYASRIIHYPGGKVNRSHFFQRARDQFSEHLKAHHTAAFPYGANGEMMGIQSPQHTTDLLKTWQQAEVRMTAWIAEQKEKGYRVVQTTFSFDAGSL